MAILLLGWYPRIFDQRRIGCGGRQYLNVDCGGADCVFRRQLPVEKPQFYQHGQIGAAFHGNIWIA
ncbi:MAG: hypothetical protein ACLRVT_03220 [Oscillospiraceae bacterium]